MTRSELRCSLLRAVFNDLNYKEEVVSKNKTYDCETKWTRIRENLKATEILVNELLDTI